MTPAELKKQCTESIERTKAGDPMIVLQVKCGKSPRSSRTTRRLGGAGSPTGRIVDWGDEFDTCFFNARVVLDYIDKTERQ